jgi:hypothetical protein
MLRFVVVLDNIFPTYEVNGAVDGKKEMGHLKQDGNMLNKEKIVRIMRLFSQLFACEKLYHRLKYFYNIFKKHAV